MLSFLSERWLFWCTLHLLQTEMGYTSCKTERTLFHQKTAENGSDVGLVLGAAHPSKGAYQCLVMKAGGANVTSRQLVSRIPLQMIGLCRHHWSLRVLWDALELVKISWLTSHIKTNSSSASPAASNSAAAVDRTGPRDLCNAHKIRCVTVPFLTSS